MANIVEQAGRWALMALGEKLDPASVPPGGSGRPKALTRRNFSIAAGAGVPIVALIAATHGAFQAPKQNLQPFPAPALPDAAPPSLITETRAPQPLFVYPGSRRETIQTVNGPHLAIITPPLELANIQDNIFLRNGASFMELAVDFTQLSLLYGLNDGRGGKVLEHDRINRDLFLTTTGAGNGVNLGQSQEHVISLTDIIGFAEQYMKGGFPPRSENDKAFFLNYFRDRLNLEILKHLRFAPNVLDDPLRREEITYFEQSTYTLIKGVSFGENGLPIQITKFNFEQAALDYETFKRQR